MPVSTGMTTFSGNTDFEVVLNYSCIKLEQILGKGKGIAPECLRHLRLGMNGSVGELFRLRIDRGSQESRRLIESHHDVHVLHCLT